MYDILLTKFHSNKELTSELNNLLARFEGKETEQNWANREDALQQFRSIVRGNAMEFEDFCSFLKPIVEQTLLCVENRLT